MAQASRCYYIVCKRRAPPAARPANGLQGVCRDALSQSPSTISSCLFGTERRLHLGLSSCGPLKRSQTHTIDAHSPQPTAAGLLLLRYSTTRPVSYTAPPVTPVPVQRLRSPTRHRYQRCSRRASLPHSPSSPSARRHDTTGASSVGTAPQQQRVDPQPRRTPHAGLRFRRAGSALLLKVPGTALRAPRRRRPQHGAALAQARQP